MMPSRHRKTKSVGYAGDATGGSPRTIHKALLVSNAKKVDSEETFLYKAVLDGDISKIMSSLQTEQVNVNWQNPFDSQRTALHRATLDGNATVVALLLGKGADVCIRDAKGITPLNIAIENGNEQILNLLANKTITSLENYKASGTSPLNMTVTQPKESFQKIGYRTEGNAAEIGGSSDLKRLSFTRSNSEGAIVASTKKETASVINKQMDHLFENKQPPNMYRIHVARQSAISEMLCISHFQTIYNIFVAVFFIAFANIFIRNYYDQGVILDFSLLFWAFGDALNAFFVWCFLFSVSFIAYFLQKAIVNNTIKPPLAYTVYIITLIVIYLGLPKYIRERGYPPATAFAISCEWVRLSMKMHSYLMVNRALRNAKERKEQDPSVQEYPRNVTLWNYFEFLWFPTLIYQTSYPRTKGVRIGYVLKRFGEVFLCITFVYAILIRYCLPHYNEMIGDIKSLFLGIFHVMMPGIAMNLLGFYCVLHSWLNAFAELTRFGDRHFYSDWWTSTSWAVYYRKWNTVVHNFLHRHIFMDCVITFHFTKNSAMWITFLISAVVHEYIIAIGLGFYKPILFLMFVFPGVFFIYLTRFLKGSRIWNIFMWAMLIVGHGMLVGLYTRAWHMHYYAKDVEQNWYDYIWIL